MVPPPYQELNASIDASGSLVFHHSAFTTRSLLDVFSPDEADEMRLVVGLMGGPLKRPVLVRVPTAPSVSHAAHQQELRMAEEGPLIRVA